MAQFRLVSLLTGPEKNICVVGDDDQSIYRFRGATIENILNFERIYKGTRTIRLEQNYRSTSNILNAANCVIQHNTERKGKTLWTKNGEGDKVQVYTAENEQDEASHIADAVSYTHLDVYKRQEWYEHSEGYCSYLKGKTEKEVADIPADGSDADLAALCTISIDALQKAAGDAFENASL